MKLSGLLIASCLAATTPALAQASEPAASAVAASTCYVAVTSAPDDVRAEIEAWVRAEPRCRCQLAVDVVATNEGLHVVARDNHGRTRQRTVPDAQSAAVMVVSWMADDAVAKTPSAPVRSVVTGVRGPSSLTTITKPSVRRPARHVWLVLGAIGTAAEPVGLRGEIDLLASATWSVSLSAGWRDGNFDASTGQGRVSLGARMLRGRFSFVAALGIGLDLSSKPRGMHRESVPDVMATARHHHDVVPAIEFGVRTNLLITDDWGVVAEPLIEVVPHTTPTVALFVGVQRRL
jgi:hypothetical protein